MDAQTTLVSHETKSGSNQRGPWTRHIFKDANGADYQTFDQNLANAAYALLNQPAVITYDAETRGQYTNNVIKAVRSAGTIGAPTAAPAAPAQAAPTSSSPDRDREIRIMRQSGLDRAIATVAAGIVQINGIGQLFQLSETFLKYFAGGPQAAQPGVQTAGQPAGAGDSSSTPGGGGVTAGPDPSAPPVAPAPAETPAPVTAPQGPQDDIPF